LIISADGKSGQSILRNVWEHYLHNIRQLGNLLVQNLKSKRQSIEYFFPVLEQNGA